MIIVRTQCALSRLLVFLKHVCCKAKKLSLGCRILTGGRQTLWEGIPSISVGLYFIIISVLTGKTVFHESNDCRHLVYRRVTSLFKAKRADNGLSFDNSVFTTCVI